MSTRVNTFALENTVFDSASLGTLAMIAHPLKKEGSYLGTVYQEEIEVGRFELKVSESTGSTQVDLDLSSFPSNRTNPRPVSHSLLLNGYLMLFVSSGPSGFWVTLQWRGEKALEPAFDSRLLGTSDLFIVTLIRPGRYQGRRSQAREAVQIEVRYPDTQQRPQSQDEPAFITCGKTGFSPDAVTIESAQGVVFSMETEAAVLVTLMDSEDDPKVLSRGRGAVRWVKPKSEREREA